MTVKQREKPVVLVTIRTSRSIASVHVMRYATRVFYPLLNVSIVREYNFLLCITLVQLLRCFSDEPAVNMILYSLF